MTYEVKFEHGILKVGDVCKVKWENHNTVSITMKKHTSSRHTRREFDAAWLHYHVMMDCHQFIDVNDFMEPAGKFLKFGNKVFTSYSPEIKAVEHKLRKHIDEGNCEKVAIYLTEAFSTDDANAEFASHWKANLPPTKAVFEEQSVIFQEAKEFLKKNGWQVATILSEDHGYQLWCLHNGEGYHSSYDWSQDE
jgi:hypothetical protein